MGNANRRDRIARARAASGAALALAVIVAGCAMRDDRSAPAGVARAPALPSPMVAGTRLGGAGEWVTQGKDFAGTRYSELDQVNASNVGRLVERWSFSTGVLHGHEGAPLVVGSTMYLVSAYPDIAYALDLTKNGEIKWKYHPGTDPWSVGVACCDVVNRGPAYADGKIIYNLLDDRTIALDANTGKLVWETKLADVNTGVTMTMAPLVVKGKVLVGNSGGEMGVQGWIAALDVATGKELWRAYSTGPDSMVKIGPAFHPFYAKDRGKNLGVSSWPVDGWKHGAGSVWGWITYDPGLDLIYYGTSNPGPWNQDQRAGDNKWTSTIFARHPDDGQAVWAYQVTPHDEWDYDAVNESILADLAVGGRTRKVLVHFDRNAYAYTIDRATGEVLVARPFANQNWSSGIDLASGAPRVVDAKRTAQGVNVQDLCPADVGGKDYEPAAFSPRTSLFYVPTQNICMDYRGVDVSYIAGTPYWGADVKHKVGPGGNYGEFIAWDAVAGKKVWGITEHFFPYSGALVTGGDVVFYGTADGWFRGVDARSGQVLWQKKLASGVQGQPMTYLGPDGKQYVAVLTGVGGASNLLAKEPGFPAAGGVLYVFSLQ